MFQRRAIPLREGWPRLRSSSAKNREGSNPVTGIAGRVVGQDELPKIGTVERGARLDRRRCEANRFRVGIRIEGGIGKHVCARPEPRNCSPRASRPRGSPSPEDSECPRDVAALCARKKRVTARVGGAPEKMHRAAFADEAGTKRVENPVSLHQHPPKPIGIFEIIGAVRFVLVETDGVGDFVGFRVNLYLAGRAWPSPASGACRKSPPTVVRAQNQRCRRRLSAAKGGASQNRKRSGTFYCHTGRTRS